MAEVSTKASPHTCFRSVSSTSIASNPGSRGTMSKLKLRPKSGHEPADESVEYASWAGKPIPGRIRLNFSLGMDLDCRLRKRDSNSGSKCKKTVRRHVAVAQRPRLMTSSVWETCRMEA